MDDNRRYEAFVRNRITELREQKGVSEHRMSLELGKSGSYIRSITNGISMPSLRELFNIMEYSESTKKSLKCISRFRAIRSLSALQKKKILKLLY